MSEQYTREILKVVVAKILQKIGWNSIQTSPLEIMIDVLHNYLSKLAKRTNSYAVQFGHTQPNLDELGLAFRDLGINISDLEEYVSSFDSSPAMEVPNYPVKKESNLNCLRPGYSGTRPKNSFPMPVEERKGSQIKEDELNQNVSVNVQQVKRSANFLQIAKYPKLIMEEGKSTREISSAMMTSSGYLSPMREGKLPVVGIQNDAIFERPRLVMKISKRPKLKSTCEASSNERKLPETITQSVNSDALLLKRPANFSPKHKIAKRVKFMEEHKENCGDSIAMITPDNILPVEERTLPEIGLQNVDSFCMNPKDIIIEKENGPAHADSSSDMTTSAFLSPVKEKRLQKATPQNIVSVFKHPANFSSNDKIMKEREEGERLVCEEGSDMITASFLSPVKERKLSEATTQNINSDAAIFQPPAKFSPIETIIIEDSSSAGEDSSDMMTADSLSPVKERKFSEGTTQNSNSDSAIFKVTANFSSSDKKIIEEIRPAGEDSCDMMTAGFLSPVKERELTETKIQNSNSNATILQLPGNFSSNDILIIEEENRPAGTDSSDMMTASFLSPVKEIKLSETTTQNVHPNASIFKLPENYSSSDKIIIVEENKPKGKGSSDMNTAGFLSPVKERKLSETTTQNFDSDTSILKLPANFSSSDKIIIVEENRPGGEDSSDMITAGFLSPVKESKLSVTTQNFDSDTSILKLQANFLSSNLIVIEEENRLADEDISAKMTPGFLSPVEERKFSETTQNANSDTTVFKLPANFSSSDLIIEEENRPAGENSSDVILSPVNERKLPETTTRNANSDFAIFQLPTNFSSSDIVVIEEKNSPLITTRFLSPVEERKLSEALTQNANSSATILQPPGNFSSSDIIVIEDENRPTGAESSDMTTAGSLSSVKEIKKNVDSDTSVFQLPANFSSSDKITIEEENKSVREDSDVMITGFLSPKNESALSKSSTKNVDSVCNRPVDFPPNLTITKRLRSVRLTKNSKNQ